MFKVYHFELLKRVAKRYTFEPLGSKVELDDTTKRLMKIHSNLMSHVAVMCALSKAF